MRLPHKQVHSTAMYRGKRRLLYKVTAHDGQGPFSFFQFSLPENGKPGDWHSIEKNLTLQRCRVGFHVTAVPRSWVGYTAYYSSTRRVFAVQVVGPAPKRRQGPANDKHKRLYRHMRLLREVVRGSAEWRKLRLLVTCYGG